MPAGSQRLVERDRAGVYCPAGRGVATGRGLGEEETAQAETIYLEHEEQLGREASSAALQGQVRREERMPGASAASSPRLLPPASPLPWNPAPLSSAGSSVSRSPVLIPCSAAFPSGLPQQTAGFTYC